MEVKRKIRKFIDKFSSSSVKILVTGGMGYIGSHTVVELMQAGFEVYIVDNLSNSNVDVLKGIEKIVGGKPHFENIDCTDYVAMDKFFSKHEGIQVIIHFAALKAVGDSVNRPLPYYRNNVVSLINLLELMPVHKIPHLVFSSSCTVYGQPDKMPVTEETPRKKAESPYGNTKQICEDIITDTIHANKDLHSILLRYFNPIGAHHTAYIGEQPNGVPENLVPYIVQTAAGIRKKLRVFGNDYNTQDGSCIRDYINVADLAMAHVAAVRRLLEDKTTNTEIFNLGTGAGTSVLELIKKFEETTGVKVPYEIVGRREGDIEAIWSETKKANKILKWKTEISIEETLASAWKWQRHIMDRESQTEKKKFGFLSGS
ncbi:MAG: UDP-glucose 4-epimerase GalE [Prevotellaceae bacterium]|jgi:UDP-glucose 4-epimerase|nr:UDP-glucose 4-epimerase GalE [Prevotellaceae bacterium]